MTLSKKWWCFQKLQEKCPEYLKISKRYQHGQEEHNSFCLFFSPQPFPSLCLEVSTHQEQAGQDANSL